jgi:hypothetical protein
MMLDLFKQFDSATANGILAAAALTNTNNPEVGEQPAILRTYGKEAAVALTEIRDRLRIPRDLDSAQTHALISKAIADTLQQSILRDADTAKILTRIGNAGRLPPLAYDVIQPREFQGMFYRLGVSRNNVEDAVKRPDDHQHLLTEGMPPEWQDISLFMKRVMSREPSRRHWLLVQSHRVGAGQKVGAAWRVFPDDVNIESAQQPVDVLKAFVEVYGVPVNVGETKALFIESELFPAGPVKIDVSPAPLDHFISSSSTTNAAGQFRVGVTYCIDIPKYRVALARHGIKTEDPGMPIGRTIVSTTTQHVPETV